MQLQSAPRPLRIVIPGGSGKLGQILASRFSARGDQVTIIARNPEPSEQWRSSIWDGRTVAAWAADLENADVVINLAGRSVNCRYNVENKRVIKESRTVTTRLIGEAIIRSNNPPTVWMNASTATIYRHAFDRPMDEHTGELGGSELDAPSTWQFSIDVAKSWEDTFFAADTPNTRKLALRTAIVMSPQHDGTFDILLGLVRRGLGGPDGTGTQYVSWIHDEDFFNAIEFLIRCDAIAGIVNLSSPNPLPNREFMAVLRAKWGTRLGLPAPAWLLEIATYFMKTESELVLKSRRVVPTRLLDAGFTFAFPHWPEAAEDLVYRWRVAHP